MKTKASLITIMFLMTFSFNILAYGAINVPSGFVVKVFASGTVRRPTSMAFDQSGRLFVSDSARGEIRILEDTNGDGVSDVVKTFATGFDLPLGIAFRGSELYVSDNGATGKITVLRDVNGDDVADVYNDIITGLTIGWHQANGLAFGPGDGKLYFTLGSTCNACNEADPQSATILRADPDGGNVEVYARGLRNAYDLTFNQRGHLFATDNGRDDLGNRKPREELNHIIQGGDYGWPDCWGKNKQPGCGGKIKPIATFPAHSSANGIAYCSQMQFPRKYHRNLFVAQYGAHSGFPATGHKVVRVKLKWLKKRKKYRARVRNFATGFDNPLDVVEGPMGALFVADYGANTIYKISYVGMGMP